MKTSKKILIIIKALFLLGITSCLLAWPTALIFPIVSFPLWVLTYVVLIFLGDYGLQYVRDTLIIKRKLEEYNSKPYKQYAIDTVCQYCGHKEVQTVDLDKLEYKCEQCKKVNAIYVTFMTAATTSPESINIPM
jgi:phage FluMu protein Com